ncbi:hypothetical protein NQ317_010023 [Molorchus minor]|uniref:Nucleoside diphosphate kinase-like domain-containing protein n=1 Tax=Molorchus minor TaxID=1323400 RepID=A0ABQ9JB25_9CUCU|nr:hypothetical protein NQ317_010023 [Molorchus minor]
MDKFEFDYNDKLDNTLDIYDKELNRVYLKRTRMDDLSTRDLFVGNKVQRIIGKLKERTLAIIKPCSINRLGEIITDIQNRRFQITKLGMYRLSRKEALELYDTRKGDSSLPFILEHINSGPVVALELVGEDAIKRFKKEMGPSEPVEARKVEPNSLRAIYGFATHATSGQKSLESPVVLKNTTCCIIKPHAIHDGNLGHIISAINESHFKITAAKMVYLSNANADEFLEVYKGVVSDYNALLLSFVDGPSVVLEIAGKNDELNVHQDFRSFVGPSDSDIARQIRPATIRARFGCDKYKNAVHCTDLPEDTILELEYMFKIIKD